MKELLEALVENWENDSCGNHEAMCSLMVRVYAELGIGCYEYVDPEFTGTCVECCQEFSKHERR